MVNLTPQSPLETLLPLTEGATVLTEATPVAITSISPARGKESALSEALKAAHGVALPAIGRLSQQGKSRVIWTGRDQFFLVGDKPAAKALAKTSALTDQTDSWAVMTLTGTDAAAVMARICPLDLRPATFKRGHTARTEVAHMMAVLSAVPKGFEIMVMRSFARTAVHHIHDAMISVAAQAE